MAGHYRLEACSHQAQARDREDHEEQQVADLLLGQEPEQAEECPPHEFLPESLLAPRV